MSAHVQTHAPFRTVAPNNFFAFLPLVLYFRLSSLLACPHEARLARPAARWLRDLRSPQPTPSLPIASLRSSLPREPSTPLTRPCACTPSRSRACSCAPSPVESRTRDPRPSLRPPPLSLAAPPPSANARASARARCPFPYLALARPGCPQPQAVGPPRRPPRPRAGSTSRRRTWT